MTEKTKPTIQNIIITLSAVVIIAGGFYLYTTSGFLKTSNEDYLNEDQNTQEVATGTKDETNNVPDEVGEVDEQTNNVESQIYKNEEYNFEVRYPEKFEFGDANPAEKLLFSITNSSGELTYEFWVKQLDGKTLEQAFEEKLNLEDISYFDWIRDQGGAVTEESLGKNTWIFIDGSEKFYLKSHYLVKMPKHDAYLVVDVGFLSGEDLQSIKSILGTLNFD